MLRILVGQWRDDSTGSMQVVSGPGGRETVHLEGPPAHKVEAEMAQLLRWINHENTLDPVLKAGIAHLWFLTIHPFEDGNGRIARAITDMLLTRSDGISQRYYSLSAQINIDRKKYYEVLESTQKATLDITAWLKWFLDCLHRALLKSEETLANILAKHTFWTRIAKVPINPRQQLMLNRLWEGFHGNLTTTKWAKITKTSQDTALRDIQDLMAKGILEKAPESGRKTHYLLVRGK